MKNGSKTRGFTDAVKGHSWAFFEGIGIVMCGEGKKKRSVLIVREIHVFSQRDAKALAKELGVKVVPHTSRLLKNRPIFDGTKKQEGTLSVPGPRRNKYDSSRQRKRNNP